MTTKIIVLGLLAACVACGGTVQNIVVVQVQPSAPVLGDADPRALTEFDDVLAGHGVWSDDATYGALWTPADATFVPYATHGRFADLDGEIVWLSDLSWGGATLHHGRWLEHQGRWRWVPGMKYSGAWVTWTRDREKTSWSPAPPTLVFKNGAAVRVTPPAEPIVGEADEVTLALRPRSEPLSPLGDADFAYRALARTTQSVGADAASGW